MVRPKSKSEGMAADIVAAIGAIRHQRQAPNLERIARFFFRKNEMDALQVEKEINAAVKTGVLERFMSVSKKGSNAGMQQESYRVPKKKKLKRKSTGTLTPLGRPPKRSSSTPRLKATNDDKSTRKVGDHDWFCFECQKAELLIHCAECWRSWHSDCTDIDVTNPETFVCAICLDLQKKTILSKKYVNTLLGYAIHRLREKARELYHLPMKGTIDKWKRLVYQPMDLSLMEEKTQGRKYKCTEEFVADARTVAHDVILSCGAESPMALRAVAMLSECMHEVDEIRQCQNCYYMSNLKPPDWFCQPCEPPHELVYAKQTGFSYWPAKVINRPEDEKFDVRFFGGYHQRAIVPHRNVKPITTNIQDISVKRTAGFVKACGELEKHKQLLEGDRPSKYRFSDSESEAETETEVEQEQTDEVDNTGEEENADEPDAPKVSSTSKVTDTKVKSPVTEDRNQVTSTEDQVPSKKRKVVESTPIQTASIHTQTKDRKVMTKTSQTVLKMGEPLCDCGPNCHQTVPEATPETTSTLAVSETKSEVISEASDVKKEETDKGEDQAKALADLQKKLQQDMEEDKQQAISRAMANMQTELEKVRKQTEDKCKEQHSEEIKKLQAKHKDFVTVVKHKQWCYNCEAEAMYHCCWNTSYCSIKCQQDHWHKEHKRVCRRKR